MYGLRHFLEDAYSFLSYGFVRIYVLGLFGETIDMD